MNEGRFASCNMTLKLVLTFVKIEDYSVTFRKVYKVLFKVSSDTCDVSASGVVCSSSSSLINEIFR